MSALQHTQQNHKYFYERIHFKHTLDCFTLGLSEQQPIFLINRMICIAALTNLASLQDFLRMYTTRVNCKLILLFQPKTSEGKYLQITFCPCICDVHGIIYRRFIFAAYKYYVSINHIQVKRKEVNIIWCNKSLQQWQNAFDEMAKAKQLSKARLADFSPFFWQ